MLIVGLKWLASSRLPAATSSIDGQALKPFITGEPQVGVDTFTAALIQLQPLMAVEPASGLFFFAAAVVLTMLGVESFDPRLIWDAGIQRGE